MRKTHQASPGKFVPLAVLAFGWALWSPALSAQPPAVSAEVVDAAEIVFVGVVKAQGVAAEADVAATDTTVSVEVERMLRPAAPSPLAAFQGRAVTVRLLEAGSPAVGSRATFYTRLWLLGRGLAVVELGHEPVAPLAALADATAGSARALAAAADRQLQARIARAEVVVVGRVKAVREIPTAAAAPPRLTEHDPMWREAIIEVEEGIKGVAASTRDISVRFPASNDVMWAGAAKFEVGQEGVFLIDDETAVAANPAMMSTPGGSATVIDADAVLAKEEAERVKRLLNQ